MRKQLTARRGERRVCLMFVHAPEGLGRFSLASEFFHEDPAAFDGYCVEVTAREVDGEPVPLGEMLGQALRGLGLADTEQPSSDAARAETYQRVSAGRRFLLVVKDAITADQVKPLIPALAPEAAVVVTTRSVLRGLYALDFLDIPLGKLPDTDSRALLAFGLGATASKIDEATVRELAALCDGYPLLIRIVAAHLVGRPRAARRFLTEVRDSETALLDMDLMQRLARFLDFTYDGLLQELRRAYRLAALIPGPDFTAAAAAVAFDTDPDHAERVLDDLVDANLLTYEEPGRYSFHSVIRADALRRAHTTDGADECAAVTGRLVTWYLDEAVPRDAALADRWRVGPVFEAYTASGTQPPPREDAIAWFEAEWRGVVACVGVAHKAGLHPVAWQLCVAVFKFLHSHGHHDAWLESHRAGLESAQQCQDIAAIMQLSSQRGAAFLAIGDLDAAHADFETSREAALRTGHMLGLQSACEWLGKVAAARRATRKALAFYDDSERVIDQAGEAIPTRQQARMRALLGLQRGRARLLDGDGTAAAAAATVAVEYFDRHSSERENLAKCLLVLASAARLTGTVDEAATLFGRAAGLFAADNLRRPQAAALVDLGDALAPTDPTAARDAFQRANALYTVLGDPAADQVQARLDDLDS